LDLLEADNQLRARLWDNAAHFRKLMSAAGFDLVPGEHPIIPIMLGDAKLASELARRLLDEGVYVIGFSYPVVPQGKARIRTQMSAAHTREHLDTAVHAFTKVGRDLGVL
ncbi:MAG: aminotransferase class I/II-fold pyridoxal phosphate-dependent enzyme, partial [Steroidobacteraceae bacterium]